MKKLNLSYIHPTRMLNVLMLLYALLVCRNLYMETMKGMSDIDLISEFLVNYQGGFVRRGLLGEILYRISLWLSLDSTSIFYIINSISIICFLGVVAFFSFQFIKKHYNWWILPLNFFLATGWIIRKDYLMILMLIAIVYAYTHIRRTLPKIILVVLLEIMLILIHEVFFFFGTLFIIMLFLRDYRLSIKKGERMCLVVLLFMVFFLVSFYKGNDVAAHIIADSWAPLLSENINPYSGTIKSLAWETLSTFKFHVRVNFIELSNGFMGLIVRPIILFLIYYLATRILFVFRTPSSELQKNDKNLLSSILSFQFIMLIPMFTILSCDAGRIVLYWLSSSFIFFLLVPRDVLKGIFPEWFSRTVNKINQGIDRFLPPTKGFIALLIVFLTITPVGFHIDWAMSRSVFGVVGTFVSDVLRSILIKF